MEITASGRSSSLVFRRRNLELALHSNEMEGGHASHAFMQDAHEYVNGRIDAHELLRRTQLRYGAATRS